MNNQFKNKLLNKVFTKKFLFKKIFKGLTKNLHFPFFRWLIKYVNLMKGSPVLFKHFIKPVKFLEFTKNNKLIFKVSKFRIYWFYSFLRSYFKDYAANTILSKSYLLFMNYLILYSNIYNFWFYSLQSYLKMEKAFICKYKSKKKKLFFYNLVNKNKKYIKFL